MHFVLTSTILATTVAAKLSHPVIKPEFEGGGLNSLHKGLEAHLPVAKYTWDHWVSDRLPEACRTIAEGSPATGHSAKDVHAFSIKYDDCPEKWHFCRHEKSPISAEKMIKIFGSMPVHMRQWVRHMVSLPADGGAHAYNAGDNIMLAGNVGTTVFVHETGHSLDAHAFYDGKQRMSSSQKWLDAYNADTAVPDYYAQTNQVENFAQNTVVALFNANVPGGVGTVQPGWRQISHQFHLIDDLIPGTIKPGGVCTHRFKNSPAVPKTGPKRKLARDGEQEYAEDESYDELSSSVIAMEPQPIPSTVEQATFDAEGNYSGSETVAI